MGQSISARLHGWWSGGLANSSRPRTHQRPRRLGMETLEDRRLLSITGAYTLSGGTATLSNQTFTSSTTDQSAILVTNGGNLPLKTPAVTTSGNTSSQDNSSFYGQNAGILVQAGSTLTMTGGTVKITVLSDNSAPTVATAASATPSPATGTTTALAAVAAGLGEFGLNGLFLSPEFGVRQRMASILTTAPLRPDDLCGGRSLCDHCGRCLRICPVNAFGTHETVSIRIGDKSVSYAKVDKWRCAWSEQLGMVAAGGPRCAGYTTNVPPPQHVTPDDYLAARTERDPFQATCAWGTISCGRCLHVCQAHKKPATQATGATP